MTDGIHCAACGRYMSYADMQSGAAQCYFEPLSEFGPEVIEWTCARCLGGAIGDGNRESEDAQRLDPKDESPGSSQAEIAQRK